MELLDLASIQVEALEQGGSGTIPQTVSGPITFVHTHTNTQVAIAAPLGGPQLMMMITWQHAQNALSVLRQEIRIMNIY